MPNLFIRHRSSPCMFEPDEESAVLGIVCGFLGISDDEMINIGEEIKKSVFDPGIGSEEEAVGRLRDALEEMSKEEALLSGIFISGLLRCNLAQQSEHTSEQQVGSGSRERDQNVISPGMSEATRIDRNRLGPCNENV